MGDRDTRDGWWTGTSDLTRKGPGSFSVSDTHGWFLPSWLYYISLQPFFFSSIPWCFSPIEREKTRIYFHHSLRPVIHTQRHKRGHQSPNHKKMKAKLENRFIVYLLRTYHFHLVGRWSCFGLEWRDFSPWNLCRDKNRAKNKRGRRPDSFKRRFN
jgi:hypothetical protein